MKELYVSPKSEIVTFDTKDVITGSPDKTGDGNSSMNTNSNAINNNDVMNFGSKNQ